MRITNTMMSNTFLRNLNTNMSLLDKYQYQLATNKRITKLSDDPTGVIKSMQARVKLYRLDQYQDNVDTAQMWLTQTETSLMELNKLVTTAYESTIQASTDLNNPSDRQAIAVLVAQLRDHALDLGNAKMGERYIFGGYNTAKQPFEVVNGVIQYNGVDMSDPNDPDLIAEGNQIIRYEIGFGVTTDVTFPGTTVMGTGDNNIYKILDDLYQYLDGNGTPEQIREQISKLQNAQSDVMALMAEVGGKTTRLNMVADRYEDDTINYTDIKSKVEDADEAEVIMNYKMAQSVYLSALQAGAQILQPSLLSYLS